MGAKSGASGGLRSRGGVRRVPEGADVSQTPWCVCVTRFCAFQVLFRHFCSYSSEPFVPFLVYDWRLRHSAFITTIITTHYLLTVVCGVLR